MSRSFTAPPKDPQAMLDYGMDWSRWLGEGEALTASVSVVVQPEGPIITLARVLPNGTEVAWRMAGGEAGEDYFVTVTVNTSSGQREERTVRVPVRER